MVTVIALLKQEQKKSFSEAAIDNRPLQIIIAENYDDARQDRKVDTDIQEWEKVVVELVLAIDE